MWNWLNWIIPKMTEQERCYVYKITCKTTQKIYIGISKNPKNRFLAHKSFARNLKEGQAVSKLAYSINKYGENDFEMEPLLCGTREYCALMEIRLIAGWNTIQDGYNIRVGGEMVEIPENCGVPRFSRYDEFLEIVRSGVHPRNIDWLPISQYRAFEILREENIPLPKYVKTEIVSPENASRLIEEVNQGYPVSNMTWWPYKIFHAYRILRESNVSLQNPRTYKNNSIPDDILVQIVKDLEARIPRKILIEKYQLTIEQLYSASAKGKKVLADRLGIEYYIKGREHKL